MALLVVVAALALPLVVAVPTSATGDATLASVDVTISRYNDTAVEYRLRFDIPASVDEYGVFLYAGRVVASDGFEPDGGSRTLAWSGAADPTITVAQRVDGVGRSGCPCAVTDRWIVARPLRIQFSSRTGEGRSTAYLTSWLSDRTVDATVTVEDGLFLPGLVYLGPYSTTTATTAVGREVRVVEPRGARTDRPIERLVGALQYGAETLDVGPPRGDTVTVVVVPRGDVDGTGTPTNSLDARGLATGRGYVYVDESVGLDTWLHEYVHTRQTFTTNRSMAWFAEATAEYYGRALAAGLRTDGTIAPAAAFGEESYANGVLSRPDSWDSTFVPYQKGGRTVAYLDARVRTLTDGNRTFLDVFRRLNGRQRLTLNDLRNATAAVVGSRALDRAITRYATTDLGPPPAESVAPPVEANGTATSPAMGTASGPREVDGSVSGPGLGGPVTLVALGTCVVVLLRRR